MILTLQRHSDLNSLRVLLLYEQKMQAVLSHRVKVTAVGLLSKAVLLNRGNWN